MMSSSNNNIPSAPVSAGAIGGSNSNRGLERRRNNNKLSGSGTMSDDESFTADTTTTTTTEAQHSSFNLPRRTRSAREQRRRQRRGGGVGGEKSDTNNNGSGSGGSGSVLWTILVIGLVFCTIDVLYIIHVVDRQQPTSSLAGGGGSSSSNRVPVPPFQKPELSPIKSNDNNNKEEKETNRVAVVAATRNTTTTTTTLQNEKTYSIPTSMKELIHDKGPIIQLLMDANAIGTNFPETIHELATQTSISSLSKQQIELIQDLPTWTDVVTLYGDTPKIYGLNQCESFQNHSPKEDHFVSTAGTFNTGTNFMAELLIANCHMEDRMTVYGKKNRGVRWQVPWGKHTPPGNEEFRQSHKTHNDASVNASDILPAVTIRDPLVWLHSMCSHEYAAHWEHVSGGGSGEQRCPNFSSEHLNLQAKVKYSDFTREYESILHLWNEYYNEYLNVEFHRLIVRFEDLVFYPKLITTTVCECAGGSMRKDGTFQFVLNSAKKGEGAHGSIRTGYVDAIIKYGNLKHRYNGYTNPDDLQWIKDHVDPNIMKIFKYSDPDLSLVQPDPKVLNY